MVRVLVRKLSLSSAENRYFDVLFSLYFTITNVKEIDLHFKAVMSSRTLLPNRLVNVSVQKVYQLKNY